MALHAVRNVERAFSVTREFLTPIEIRRWLKLALVVFFVGTSMQFPSAQTNVSGTSDSISVDEIPVSIPADIIPVIVALALIGLLIAVIFALIGAIMEFVLIEALRTEDVTIRRHWRNRWRQGIRLFGFRILIGLPFLALFVSWLGLLIVPLYFGIGLSVPFIAFLFGVPVLFLGGLIYGLVSMFTTVFVVPIMIRRDGGVLDGWRQLWGSINRTWKEYLAYAVIAFLLTIALGLAASIVGGIVALALLVPTAIIAGVIHLSITLTSTAGIIIMITLAVLFGATMLIVWAVVQVPVVTYLRYYALLVLGDIEPEFDLIPDRRPPEETDTAATDGRGETVESGPARDEYADTRDDTDGADDVDRDSTNKAGSDATDGVDNEEGRSQPRGDS